MKQYLVEFKVSSKRSPAYYTVDSLEEAYQLIDNLIEKAEGWEDNWEGKITKAKHIAY